MILESIVTSIDAAGTINLAPMGPLVSNDLATTEALSVEFTLRPFKSSQTYANLTSRGKAVIHVTDDVDLFARAAVDHLTPEHVRHLVTQIDQSDWWVLNDCHRWFAITVLQTSEDGPRVRMRCRTEQSGVIRPFFGLNRAKHAVIEAAILATRTHLLDPEFIAVELDRLQPLVDKTAGAQEKQSFDFLRQVIDERLAKR